jgi:hypothetical protein
MVELIGARLQILIVNVLKLMYLKETFLHSEKIGTVVDLILHKWQISGLEQHRLCIIAGLHS